MIREELLARLRELPILLQGNFTLRSGEKSEFYLDVKKAYGYPDLLNLISDSLWLKVSPETTCIAASGYGGISSASVLASRYNLNLALVRDNLKSHGRASLIDGYVPNSKDIVSIVDDVFTSGDNLREVIKIIEPTGAKIAGCHVVVKRGEGALPFPLNYLFTLQDLLQREVLHNKK